MSSAALTAPPSAIPLPADLSASDSPASSPTSPCDSGDKENEAPLANMSADASKDSTAASTAAGAGDDAKPASASSTRSEGSSNGQLDAAHGGKEERSDSAPPPRESSKAEKEEEPSSAAAPTPLDASYMDAMESAALLSHGQALLSGKRWNLACEALSRCVERAAAEYGDTALPLAPLYALYGRALVEHWLSAQDALGDKLREAQAEKKINEGAGGLIGEEDEEEGGQAQGETDDSMAWEALDLARVIYQRRYDAMATGETATPTAAATATTASSSSAAPSTPWLQLVPATRPEVGLALIRVLLRLGDLHQEQEKFVEAATDYSQALSLQRALLPPHSREIASTHMELAVCSLWQHQPAVALQHYTLAYNQFHYGLLWLMAGKPSSAVEQQPLSGDIGEEKRLLESRAVVLDTEWRSASEEDRKEAAEYKDLIAELKERIDEMIAEIGKQSTSSASPSSSSASSSSSSSTSSSGSSGFSATPFAIPSLAFSASSSSTASPSPAAPSSSSLASASSSELVGTKRKADEEEPTVVASGKEQADASSVFNVPVVKRKKL